MEGGELVGELSFMETVNGEDRCTYFQASSLLLLVSTWVS